MEPNYLTKSDAQLNPNISRTENDKRRTIKRTRIRNAWRFTSEVWVFSVFREF